MSKAELHLEKLSIGKKISLGAGRTVKRLGKKQYGRICQGKRSHCGKEAGFEITFVRVGSRKAVHQFQYRCLDCATNFTRRYLSNG